MSDGLPATKPTLTLLHGRAFRDINAVDEFMLRLLGRRMTPDEKAYAAERLSKAGGTF